MQPSAAPPLPSAIHWDRRRRHPTREHGLHLLERAARHLALDQMHPARTFNPGARDALALLWSAMDRLRSEEVAQQRSARLQAAWLSRPTLARIRRSDACPDLLEA